jgi:hypothetical protein
MIMDNEQQKVDVRISDIIVSISPAAVRTLIAVTSSLGTLQVNNSKWVFMNRTFFLFFLDNGFRRKREGEFEIII